MKNLGQGRMKHLKQERRLMLNAQSVERKFGEEMTLYLLPILHSMNMTASVDGLDMLLFNKAAIWND